MPENTKECTPFALSLMVSGITDGSRRFTFGLAKGCRADNEATWAITFKLEELVDEEWKVRVDFKLDINQEAPAKTEQAKELAETEQNKPEAKRLSEPQRAFVRGPMYIAAVRESQRRPEDSYLVRLNEMSKMGDSIVRDANRLLDRKISDEEERLFANFAPIARRRPGLKELSIAFLDIE